jgi:hypothetical protein
LPEIAGAPHAVKVRTARQLAEETGHSQDADGRQMAGLSAPEAAPSDSEALPTGAGREQGPLQPLTLSSTRGEGRRRRNSLSNIERGVRGSKAAVESSNQGGLDLMSPALALLGLKWKEDAAAEGGGGGGGGDAAVRREDSILSTGTNTEGSSFELMV